VPYHPLTNETGGDEFARNREAHSIVIDMELEARTEAMTQKERDFVEQSKDRLERYGVKAAFSAKQIFWLRDLKTKYIA
jgi:hypothetical protein